VRAGDACILGERDGIILHADPKARRAVVSIEGTEVIVHRLKELLIPVSRVEEKVTKQVAGESTW
jgi:hypothetical protein